MNPAAKEPEPKRGPNVRVKPFGYFGAFAKVTRRQGGTLSRRYRSNGYVLITANHEGPSPITAHKKMPRSLNQGISLNHATNA
jgi:hypothetical protein